MELRGQGSEVGPLEWIPWQRYVMILRIDGVQKNLGRFRRKEKLNRKAEELNMFRGYWAEVIDTKQEESD
jgi:hypothetical protein